MKNRDRKPRCLQSAFALLMLAFSSTAFAAEAEQTIAPSAIARPRPPVVVAQLRRTEVRYKRPRYGLARLDWCRLWARECGRPAADAFCRHKGHSRAVRWGKANNIGATERTIVIGTGAICDRPFCDGFAFIDCTRG